MTADRFNGRGDDPEAEIPEADRLEQLAPVDPNEDDEAPQPLAAAKQPVSEGDWVEQQRAVPLDDEDADAELS
ncbi:hypothetical protein [Leucobacter sp. wl10]|uniref:hypothetical protein n=1 Tax=Leucobacter sp. wl10 TaxID=2304677 RepID=UPI0013C2AF4F|nr:hypothetical protein [Leucobacter sp. wl10]